MKTHKPNFLFIMTDQQRWDFVGYAGASFLRTPNIDRIARRGMRFTNCFTNSPICSPARICLATGQQATRIAPVANSSFLSHTATTYYQRLRNHGYLVGCCGKLDLMKQAGGLSTRGERPSTFMAGFTHPYETEGKWHAGNHPHVHGPYSAALHKEGLQERFAEDYGKRGKSGFTKGCWDSILPPELFADTFIGDRSLDVMDRLADSGHPWHMFVSFVGPHDPFDPPAKYAEQYRETPMPKAIVDSREGKTVTDIFIEDTPEAPVETARRQYCAAITAIDDAIGVILDKLEQSGQLDTTCIIFTSDHGEMLGDHGMWEKRTAYEPSIHIPLCISGPGITAGESTAFIELMDLNPTICELAGLPPQPYIDARSFYPLLRGTQDTHRDFIMSSMPGFWCYRDEQHKLVQFHNAPPELYDLQTDPDECINHAQTDQATRGRLAQKLRQRVMEGQWLR